MELLRGPGNELVLTDEYDYHPRWGEGPWLLSPKGPGAGSAAAPAPVRAERCAIGSRLVTGFGLGGLRVSQETILWDGADRVEFRTHVDGSIGQDALLRVRFPADVPGALPVYQCATSVVGRPFGTPDADVAQHAFTLDNPAHEWFGLGAAARVVTHDRAWPIGVAEVIVPAVPNECRAAVRDLVTALAGQGVTATCSRPDGPRYGALDLDSNVPDCRIALGGPDVNPWTARLLAALGPAGELARRLAEASSTEAGSTEASSTEATARRPRTGPAARGLAAWAGRGSGCRPGARAPRCSGRTPTCAATGTCRCSSSPVPTWRRRSPRWPATWPVGRSRRNWPPAARPRTRRWPATAWRCSTAARPAAWSAPTGRCISG